MSEGTAQATTAERAPLDDVMLAMDVVDTLRRRQQLVEREFDEEGRALDLKERLRKIYAAQGIAVPDQVIEEGVAALREDRFVYRPPAPSLATRLAHLYVRRRRWGRWVLAGAAALVLGASAYYATIVAPRAALPHEVDGLHDQILALAKSDPARGLVASYRAAAESALEGGNEKTARQMLAAMKDLRETLEQEYALRIVSRPGEHSGVWRVPDDNSDAKNYYLIVEAIDTRGNAVTVEVTSEETGKRKRVSQWGLRVSEADFHRVAADKQDDGIIQNNRFGVKRRGFLDPEYEIPTAGGALTEW